MEQKNEEFKNIRESLPQYCDYFCKYAAFTDPNSIGACRKELVVWCKLHKRYNNKNNKCFGQALEADKN